MCNECENWGSPCKIGTHEPVPKKDNGVKQMLLLGDPLGGETERKWFVAFFFIVSGCLLDCM